METEIIVAAIGALGSILSALAAAVAAALIGRQFIKQEALKKKLAAAQQDVAFLLEVERRYGERLKVYEDSTRKNTVRREVREETYLDWSGSNTFGRIQYQTGEANA